MTYKEEIIGAEGLRFFGRISASISHEIKNTLAIINENAGLLEDFSMMTEKGLEISPARLKKLAGTVRKQVRRADGIVNRMNRFAHSVDEPVKAVDLVPMMELLVSLVGRIADTKEIVVETAVTERQVPVTTSPFILENLTWRCLEFSMETVNAEKILTLSVEGTEKGAIIRISGIGALPAPDLNRFPSQTEREQCRVLNAEVGIHSDGGEITIALPGKINGV